MEEQILEFRNKAGNLYALVLERFNEFVKTTTDKGLQEVEFRNSLGALAYRLSQIKTQVLNNNRDYPAFSELRQRLDAEGSVFTDRFINEADFEPTL